MPQLDLGTLNPEQRDAVTSVDGPLMILAGAGTGKTRVITFRIAYMLDAGIPPASIVALSFTNKAAREMAHRAQQIAGERVKKAWLGTFHSFCLAILRRFPLEAGVARGFTLAGTSDQIDLVRRGLEERGWSGIYDAEKLHAQIGIAKNALLSPEDIPKAEIRKWCQDPAALAAVYDLYERQLRLNRVIDFDDCIYRTVKLLRENPAVRERLRGEFRYLMVDEFQDTNVAQLTVMELLASDNHDVCVVGDDDQSIYSWRGAMYEILERFEALFPKSRMIKLEQNYRCTNVILGAANHVIKNNAQRKAKSLWSESADQTPILLTPCDDETAEANFVAEKCMSLLGRGMKPQDIAVLYRANAQAKAMELALREARIPYKTFGGQSFFERKEVKDFLCYLRLVLDPDDRLALWRIINVPARGVGMKTLEKIEALAVAAKKSPFAVLASGEDLGLGRAEPAIREFVAMIKDLAARPMRSVEDAEAVAAAVLRGSGLENEVRVKTEDGGSREKKLQNLKSLPTWIGTLAKDAMEGEEFLDPKELLDTLTLDGDRREEKDGPRSYVSLMTIHASKGLEFPAVFVVGLEEEQLPHRNSIMDPQALCEERRLFYVALTRAKTNLYLSHCHERSGGYGKTGFRQPSRFLKELPAGLALAQIPDAEARAKSLEERKVKTVSRLAELRANLYKPKQL